MSRLLDAIKDPHARAGDTTQRCSHRRRASNTLARVDVRVIGQRRALALVLGHALLDALLQRLGRASLERARSSAAGKTLGAGQKLLGTEGAAYADVGLKDAVNQGIIAGPRLYVTTKAIVATGSYGPKGFGTEIGVPQGAEEADGVEGLTRVVRDQIGKGADWIKIYADYRYGPRGEARPTFTAEEWQAIVRTARPAARPVVAHASTADGMKLAILAGVETIDCR